MNDMISNHWGLCIWLILNFFLIYLHVKKNLNIPVTIGWSKPSVHNSANGNTSIKARKQKFQKLATQAIERRKILKKKAVEIDKIFARPTDDTLEEEGKSSNSFDKAQAWNRKFATVEADRQDCRKVFLMTLLWR